MGYFEQARHWSRHVELTNKADVCRRAVRKLEEQLAREPGKKLCDELEAAKQALTAAEAALAAHGGPLPVQSAPPQIRMGGGAIKHWPGKNT